MIVRLLQVARPVAGWLAVSLLCRVVSLVAGIYLLVVPAAAFTLILDSGSVDVALVLMHLVAAAVVKAVTRYGEQYFGHRAAFTLIADMRLRVYDAVVPLGADDADVGRGDVTVIATREVDRVEVFFAHTVVPFIAAIIVPGAVVALCFTVGPLPGVIALAAMLVGGVAVPLLGHATSKRAARNLISERAALTADVSTFLAATAEVQSLHAEDTVIDVINRRGRRISGVLARAGRIVAMREAASVLWVYGAAVAIIALAEPDFGTSLIAAVAVVAAAPAVTAVEAFVRSLPLALASADRYLTLIDSVPAHGDPVHPAAVPDGPLSVEFDRVDYSYPGAARPTIDGLSLRVSAGGELVIGGPSGSGKSTIASLLVRQRHPSQGTIRIGGIDIATLARADLVAAVAVVEQRPVLFSGTIADNLRVGNPDLSDDDAWRALERVSLADDVRQSDSGLGTLLGEGGLNFSGGQRQRLCLARALARRPRILVLDEATSHQDPEAQRAIVAGIGDMDMTIITITHDPAVRTSSDSVVLLGQK